MTHPSAGHITPDLAKPSTGSANDYVSTTAVQPMYQPNSIPKPIGEAGKPGVGGYNVQIAMGWSIDDYRAALVRAWFSSIFPTLMVNHY
jgi:hypothetical protein